VLNVIAGAPGEGAIVTYRYETPSRLLDMDKRITLADAGEGRLVGATDVAPQREASDGLAAALPMLGDSAQTQPRHSEQASLPAGPAAGTGVHAGALLGLLYWLVNFVLVPLFSRITRDEVLESQLRRRLLQAIREQPGVHMARLIELTGLGNGATRHHLRNSRTPAGWRRSSTVDPGVTSRPASSRARTRGSGACSSRGRTARFTRPCRRPRTRACASWHGGSI